MAQSTDPPRNLQRTAYLVSLTAGDMSSFQRGTLGRRCVRRKVNRSVAGPLRLVRGLND